MNKLFGSQFISSGISRAIKNNTNGLCRRGAASDLTLAPTDIATCMYHAWIDPSTKKPVRLTKGCATEKSARINAVLQAGELHHGSRSIA